MRLFWVSFFKGKHVNVTSNTFSDDKSSVLVNSQSVSSYSHLSWLDQIRGCAALYVVCHHAVRQVIIIGNHAHDPFYRFLQLATGFGHYAVDIFYSFIWVLFNAAVNKKTAFWKYLKFLYSQNSSHCLAILWRAIFDFDLYLFFDG